MRRFVCVLTASKGVVSGSGASMVVGKVAEIYAVRMHETTEMVCLTDRIDSLRIVARDWNCAATSCCLRYLSAENVDLC
jgi:hypothetical protein